MRKIIALCVLFAVIAVVHCEDAEPVPILKSESNLSEDGSYTFEFEGGDGSARQETGTILNAGTDDETLEISGSYKYIDSDGEEVSVHYTAGANGFVPVGSNIPQEISDAAAAAATATPE